MPFKSDKQRKYMFARHPEIAKRWVSEARKSGVSIISKLKKKK